MGDLYVVSEPLFTVIHYDALVKTNVVTHGARWKICAWCPTHYLQSSITMPSEKHQFGDPSCSLENLYVVSDPLFIVIHYDALGKTQAS